MGLLPDGGKEYSYDGAVDELARRYGVPKALYTRLTGQESSNRDDVTSSAGAKTRWQIIDSTARMLGYEPEELQRNPLKAAEAGLRLLRDSYKKFRPQAQNDKHGWMLAAAAYHAGDGAVEHNLKAGGLGLPNTSDGFITTRNYVLRMFNDLPGANLDRSPYKTTKGPQQPRLPGTADDQSTPVDADVTMTGGEAVPDVYPTPEGLASLGLGPDPKAVPDNPQAPMAWLDGKGDPNSVELPNDVVAQATYKSILSTYGIKDTAELRSGFNDRFAQMKAGKATQIFSVAEDKFLRDRVAGIPSQAVQDTSGQPPAPQKLILGQGEYTQSEDQAGVAAGQTRVTDTKGRTFLATRDMTAQPNEKGQEKWNIVTELPGWLKGTTPGKTELPRDPVLQKSFKTYRDTYHLPDTEDLRQKFIKGYGEIKAGRAQTVFTPAEMELLDEVKTYQEEHPQPPQPLTLTDKKAGVTYTEAEDQKGVRTGSKRVTDKATGKTAIATQVKGQWQLKPEGGDQTANAPAPAQAPAKKTVQAPARKVEGYDFERTGVLQTNSGKKLYLSPDRTNLDDGEFRFTDDAGETYKINPKAGGQIVDESLAKPVDQFDLKLLPQVYEASTTPEAAKRAVTGQISEHLSQTQALPRSDIQSFYEEQGLKKLDTGAAYGDKDYFEQKPGQTEPFTVTRRDVKDLQEYSTKRRKALEDWAIDQVASGRDFSKDELAQLKENDVDLGELAARRRDDYELAKVKAGVAKEDFQRYLGDFEAKENDSYLARLKAEQKIGWIPKKTAQAEIDAYTQLHDETKQRLLAGNTPMDLGGYGLAKVGTGVDHVYSDAEAEAEASAYAADQLKRYGSILGRNKNYSRADEIATNIGTAIKTLASDPTEKNAGAGVLSGIAEALGGPVKDVVKGVWEYSLPAMADQLSHYLMGKTVGEDHDPLPQISAGGDTGIDAVGRFFSTIAKTSDHEGVAFKAGKFIGSTATELVPFVIGTELTGGSIILGMAGQGLLAAKGRGEGLGGQAYGLGKGVALGLVFAGASKAGDMAYEAATDAILARSAAKALKDPAFEEAFTKAKDLDIDPTVQAAEQKALRQAAFTGALAKNLTRIGVVGGAGYGEAKLEGQPEGDARKQMWMWAAQEAIISYLHTPEARRENLDGQILRIADPNAPTNVLLIDTDHGFEVYDAPDAPEGVVDATIIPKPKAPQGGGRKAIAGDTKTAADRAADFTPVINDADIDGALADIADKNRAKSFDERLPKATSTVAKTGNLGTSDVPALTRTVEDIYATPNAHLYNILEAVDARHNEHADEIKGLRADIDELRKQKATAPRGGGKKAIQDQIDAIENEIGGYEGQAYVSTEMFFEELFDKVKSRAKELGYKITPEAETDLYDEVMPSIADGRYMESYYHKASVQDVTDEMIRTYFGENQPDAAEKPVKTPAAKPVKAEKPDILSPDYKGWLDKLSRKDEPLARQIYEEQSGQLALRQPAPTASGEYYAAMQGGSHKLVTGEPVDMQIVGGDFFIHKDEATGIASIHEGTTGKMLGQHKRTATAKNWDNAIKKAKAQAVEQIQKLGGETEGGWAKYLETQPKSPRGGGKLKAFDPWEHFGRLYTKEGAIDPAEMSEGEKEAHDLDPRFVRNQHGRLTLNMPGGKTQDVDFDYEFEKGSWPHIQWRSADGGPMPISETGYRSQFLHGLPLAGIKDFPDFMEKAFFAANDNKKVARMLADSTAHVTETNPGYGPHAYEGKRYKYHAELMLKRLEKDGPLTPSELINTEEVVPGSLAWSREFLEGLIRYDKEDGKLYLTDKGRAKAKDLVPYDYEKDHKEKRAAEREAKGTQPAKPDFTPTERQQKAGEALYEKYQAVNAAADAFSQAVDAGKESGALADRYIALEKKFKAAKNKATVAENLVFEGLKKGATGERGGEVKPDPNAIKEYIHDVEPEWADDIPQFERRDVPIANLEKATRRPLKLEQVDMGMADRSRSVGPVVLDDDYSVIDGMHRIADKLAAGDRVLDAFVRVQQEPERTTKFKLASTQVDLPDDVAKSINAFARNTIPEKDLAGDGYETDIHITAKYGLEDDDPKALAKALANFGPIEIELGTKTKVFPATESSDDADVIYIPVKSVTLKAVNAIIADKVKTAPSDFDYKPHITLAYVKKGYGEKYAGRGLGEKLAGRTVTFPTLQLSDKNGEKIDIDLGPGLDVKARPEPDNELESAKLAIRKVAEMAGPDGFNKTPAIILAVAKELGLDPKIEANQTKAAVLGAEAIDAMVKSRELVAERGAFNKFTYKFRDLKGVDVQKAFAGAVNADTITPGNADVVAGIAGKIDPEVRQTPGTRIKWRNVTEWLAGLDKLAERQQSSGDHENAANHWRALASPSGISIIEYATEKELEELREAVDVGRSGSGRARVGGHPEQIRQKLAPIYDAISKRENVLGKAAAMNKPKSGDAFAIQHLDAEVDVVERKGVFIARTTFPVSLGKNSRGLDDLTYDSAPSTEQIESDVRGLIAQLRDHLAASDDLTETEKRDLQIATAVIDDVPANLQEIADASPNIVIAKPDVAGALTDVAAGIAKDIADRKQKVTSHFQYDLKLNFIHTHNLSESLIDDEGFKKLWAAGVIENPLGGNIMDVAPELFNAAIVHPDPFIKAYEGNPVIQKAANEPYSAAQSELVRHALRAAYSGVEQTLREKPAKEVDPTEAAFDDAFTDAFGEETLSDLAKTQAATRSALENTKKGLEEGVKGLIKLFDPTKFHSVGIPAFDEKQYELARPLFIQAIQHFKAAGSDTKTAVKSLIDYLRTEANAPAEMIFNMKPYIVRFAREMEAGTIKFAEPETAITPQEEAKKPFEPKNIVTDDKKHGEQAVNYGTADNPNVIPLAKALGRQLLEGATFPTINQARNAAAYLLGGKIQAGTLAAKAVDEAMELAGVIAARDTVAMGQAAKLDDAHVYDNILDLADRLPNLNVRTSQSMIEQAYSTPLPIAYVASRLAGVGPGKTVYEPSAGNGALLIDAPPRLTLANEINKARAEALKTQNFHVSERDAADPSITVGMQSKGGVDVVIANPPFGTVDTSHGDPKIFWVTPPNGEKFETRDIDHAIVFNSLKAMKPDGRAVFIVGGVQGQNEQQKLDKYNAGAKRKFYYQLYRNYNVVAHYALDGALYKKQGASYPVDLIVIDGVGKSALTLPAAKLPQAVTSFSELKELLNDQPILAASKPAIGDRPGGASELSDGDRDQGPVQREPRAGDVLDTPRPQTQGHTGSLGRPGGGGTADIQPSGRGESGGEGTAGTQLAPGPRDTERPATELSDAGGGIRDDAEGARDIGSGSRKEGDADRLGAVDNGDIGRGSDELIDRANDETPLQVAYKPQSTSQSVDTLLPVNMQTPVMEALKDLHSRVGDLDHYVETKLDYPAGTFKGEGGKNPYFSAEQIDALGLAIDNLEREQGFIIGDQTGVGKGRFVAGIIRYAIVHGKTPVFITEKPNLYADMYRDLRDIGFHPDEIAILATNASLRLKLEGDIYLKTAGLESHRDLITQTANEGNLQAPFNMLFTTYSQLQTVKKQRTVRHDLLEALAPNAIVIMDESHNAGGTENTRGITDAAGNPQLDRAVFCRNLVGAAKGTVYSSATYAKRPSVMSLYKATDLGLLNLTDGDYVKGGVPLQQVIAAMLSKAGQYLRREKSFKGITFNRKDIEVDKKMAAAISGILKGIQVFGDFKRGAVDKLDNEAAKEGMKVGEDGSIGQAGATSTNFTSLMHNLIDQMLLILKVDAAVDDVIEHFKMGEKPVIALANTMGSFIENYVKDFEMNPGDGLALDFGDIIKKYLTRSREVVIKDWQGKVKERRTLTDDELGEYATKLYEKVLAEIDATNFSHVPLSPIDYIHTRLREAGIRSGEITGRKHILEYPTSKTTMVDDGRGGEHEKLTSIYRVRPTRQTKPEGRKEILDDYNNGKLDALIINQAGSTGLSAHASPVFDERPIKPRYMAVLQAERNIDTFMQILGRINRTGQVELPRYSLLTADIPAEKRPAAVLMNKMAMLNANTTGSRKGKTQDESVLDFMNKYGDHVVAELMWDDPALHRLLGEPLKINDAGDGYNEEGAARKVTGWIPLLSLPEQEQLYDYITEAYTDFITQLDALGENGLEAKTFELDARQISKEVIFEGAGDSPFASPAYAELLDIKRLSKPFTTEQVTEKLQDRLDTEETDPEAIQQLGERDRRSMVDTADVDFEIYKTGELEKYADKPDRAEAETERLRVLQNTWHNAMHDKVIGGEYFLGTMSGPTYGVLVDIKRKGHTKNPLALGDWDLTFAVADGSRQIKIGLRKVVEKDNDNHDVSLAELGEIAGGRVLYKRARQNAVKFQTPDGPEYISVYDLFNKGQIESREQRTAITGNLVAGFGTVNHGQFIYYTDNRGELQQGILMPKGFSVKDATEKKAVYFRDEQEITGFIRAYAGRAVVKTEDEEMSVRYQNGTYTFITAASRARGGRYFLNRGILDAADGQQFVKSSGAMRLQVYDQGVAEQVLDAAGRESGGPWKATAMKTEARKFTESNRAPKPEDRSILPPLQSLRSTEAMDRLENLRTTADLGRVLPLVASEDKGAYVAISPEASELINAAIENEQIKKYPGELIPLRKAQTGTMLEPDVVHEVADGLEELIRLAKDRGYQGGDLAGTRQLITDIRKVAKRYQGSVALSVFADQVPHEKIHQGSFVGSVDEANPKGKKRIDRYDNPQQFAVDKSFKAVWRSLDALYGRELELGDAIEEGLAYLSNGDYQLMGVSREDAIRLIVNIARSYEAKNGPGSLSHFAEADALLFHEAFERLGYDFNKKRSAEALTKAQGEADGEDDEGGGAPPEGPGGGRTGSEPPDDESGGGKGPRGPGDINGRGETKLASFPQTLRDRGYDVEDLEYKAQPHEETEQKAKDLEDRLGAVDAVSHALADVQMQAESMRVLTREIERKARELEEYESNNMGKEADAAREELAAFAADVARSLINIGRAEESVKMLEPMSPEAMKLTATRLKQGGTGDENATLSEDESKALEKLAAENADIRNKLKAIERELEKLRPVQEELSNARKTIERLLAKLDAKKGTRKAGSRLYTRVEKKVEESLATTFEQSLEALKRAFAETPDEPVQSLIGIKGAANLTDGEERTLNYVTAQSMEAAGKDATAIWLATGWERGVDGHWRTEINGMNWRGGKLDTTNAMQDLADMIDFPELFKAYPAMEGWRVLLSSQGLGEATGTALMASRTIQLAPNRPDSALLETLKHEIQHVIQDIEGFAVGSSPGYELKEMMADAIKRKRELMYVDPARRGSGELRGYKPGDPALKEINRLNRFIQEGPRTVDHRKALRQYYATAGEVEARNAASRMMLGSDISRMLPPSSTEDTARRRQIVRTEGTDKVVGGPLQSLASPTQTELDQLVDVGAMLLFRGQKRQEVYGKRDFESDMIDEFGKGVERNLPKVHALAQIKLDQLRKKIALDRRREIYRAKDGNADLSNAEIDEQIANDLTARKAKAKGFREHQKVAREFNARKSFIQKIEALTDSEEIAYAASLLKQKGMTPRALIAELMDTYDLTPDEAHRIAADAKTIISRISGARTPEERGLEKEEADLKARQAVMRQQLDRFLRSLTRPKRTPLGKVRRAIQEVLAVPRAMQTSLNMHIGRQGLFSLLAHPVAVTWKGAIPGTLKGFTSWTRKDFEKKAQELRNTDGYYFAKQAGVDFSELPGFTPAKELGIEEDELQGTWVQKVPWVRLSTQGFVLGMNTERLLLFNLWRNVGDAAGYTFEDNEDFYREIASIVNDATGRGKAPKAVETAMKLTNQIIYSARLKVSQVKIVNDLINPYKYYKYDPVTQRIMVKEFIRSTLMLLAAYTALIYMGGSAADDPDSPDMFKVTFGDTHYDLTGGTGATFRAGYRFLRGIALMAAGERLDSQDQPQNVALHFIRTKLAPWPTSFVDYLERSNVVGEPANLGVTTNQGAAGNITTTMRENIIARMLIPIVIEDITTGFMDDGWVGAAKTLPVLPGISLQTYPPSAFTKLPATTRLAKEQFPAYHSDEEFTPEQEEAYKMRQKLRDDARSGALSPKATTDLIDQLVKNGQMSPGSASYLKGDLKWSDLQDVIRHNFTVSDKDDIKALKTVLAASSPDEVAQIADILLYKRDNVGGKVANKAAIRSQYDTLIEGLRSQYGKYNGSFTPEENTLRAATSPADAIKAFRAAPAAQQGYLLGVLKEKKRTMDAEGKQAVQDAINAYRKGQ